MSEISDDGVRMVTPEGVSEQTAVMGNLGTEASHLLFAGMGTVCRLSQQSCKCARGAIRGMKVD